MPNRVRHEYYKHTLVKDGAGYQGVGPTPQAAEANARIVAQRILGYPLPPGQEDSEFTVDHTKKQAD